jgi:hypothetical protein
VRMRTRVCDHPEAAEALLNLWEGLAVLREAAGPDPARHVALGLRVAWAHAATLSSLPVRPSRYDLHATGPPRAARPTRDFAPEIRAWARTLEGDLRDYAEVVASDLQELRDALEEDNPLLRAAVDAAREAPGALLVLRNRTAERALREEAGEELEELTVRTTWLRRLHEHGSCPVAIVPGTPPRAAWPHLDGGLAPALDMPVLGADESLRMARALRRVREARRRWASAAVRALAWRALVGSDPPPAPAEPDEEPEGPQEEIVGRRAVALADPFSPLADLMSDDRPLLSEYVEERVARPDPDGTWSPDTEAVALETLDGRLLVPPNRMMDRILPGERAESVPASKLRPGDQIVVGRREARVNLVEALEERMQDRTDLWTARLLVEGFRESLTTAVRSRGWTPARLHEAMRSHNSTISYDAVAAWLRGDVMAPQDTEDLRRLGEILDIALVQRRLYALRRALGRWRGFRRAAGRALARMAAAAVTAPLDPEDLDQLGMDEDDLREAVLVTRVRSVARVEGRVPWSEIGRFLPGEG